MTEALLGKDYRQAQKMFPALKKTLAGSTKVARLPITRSPHEKLAIEGHFDPIARGRRGRNWRSQRHS